MGKLDVFIFSLPSVCRLPGISYVRHSKNIPEGKFGGRGKKLPHFAASFSLTSTWVSLVLEEAKDFDIEFFKKYVEKFTVKRTQPGPPNIF